MDFLNYLIPKDYDSLVALDAMHHFVHITLVLFLLFGWLWRRAAKVHFYVVGLVLFSWLGLGIYVGHVGYCILTDWHWRVKWALDEGRNLPPSYLEYLYTYITGHDADDTTVSALAATTLLIVTVLSFRNYRRR